LLVDRDRLPQEAMHLVEAESEVLEWKSRLKACNCSGE
jgi:hypothetical protein